MGFGGALMSQGVLLLGELCWWSLVCCPNEGSAGECTLFLSDLSMQQGGKWAVACRKPETGRVKDVLVTRGNMG